MWYKLLQPVLDGSLKIIKVSTLLMPLIDLGDIKNDEILGNVENRTVAAGREAYKLSLLYAPSYLTHPT